MTSFPCTHVRLPVHAEVSTAATSNNDRTKIDYDKVVLVTILKVMKKAVEIIKTYSYRYLDDNKIKQFPPGIFSNLSELRNL